MRCHAYGPNISGELTKMKIAKDGLPVVDWYDEEPFSKREALIAAAMFIGAWLFFAGPFTWLAGVLL